MKLQAFYSVSISASSQGDPAWFTDNGDLFRQRLIQSVRKASRWTGTVTKFACTKEGVWSVLVTVDRSVSGISKTDATVMVKACLNEVLSKFCQEHTHEVPEVAPKAETEASTEPAEETTPATPEATEEPAKTKTTRNSRKKAEQAA